MAFELIRNFFTAGAITYSSKYLTNKILSEINFQHDNVIVEIGAGNGCISREILKQLNPNSVLISIELNPVFAEVLEEIKDERFKYVINSAENLNQILTDLNLSKPTYIISSIPFKILPNKVKRNILEEIKKVLDENAIFIHYSYFKYQGYEFKKIFNKVTNTFEFRNIPPAYIFRCSN